MAGGGVLLGLGGGVRGRRLVEVVVMVGRGRRMTIGLLCSLTPAIAMSPTRPSMATLPHRPPPPRQRLRTLRTSLRITTMARTHSRGMDSSSSSSSRVCTARRVARASGWDSD